jgi:hypothetical protein
MKRLQTVALADAFLLPLLEQKRREKIQSLLRQACHRTGKRGRNTPAPLYRIRLALANLQSPELIPNSKIGMMHVSFTRFSFQAFQPMPVSSLLVSRKSLDGFRV